MLNFESNFVIFWGARYYRNGSTGTVKIINKSIGPISTGRKKRQILVIKEKIMSFYMKKKHPNKCDTILPDPHHEEIVLQRF